MRIIIVLLSLAAGTLLPGVSPFSFFNSPPASRTPDQDYSKTAKLGFMSLFKHFKFLIPSQEPTPKQTLQAICGAKSGTFVNGECLEFFSERVDFISARSSCSKKGGDLWVPPIKDLDNPFFLQKLIVLYPHLFYTTQNKFWVGIFRTGDRFSTIDGDDVADTSLLRISDSAQGDCVTLTYSTGPLIASPELCQEDPNNPQNFEFAYVCEYSASNFVHPKTSSTSFFNKLWKA